MTNNPAPELSSQLAPAIASAILVGGPVPAFDATMTLDEAYGVQHDVLGLCAPEGLAGIKAGMTTPASQSFFGIDKFLLGGICPKTVQASGWSVPFRAGRLIECEVALRVDGEGRPIALAPALELVSLNFARETDINATNLLAANLGAEFIVLGEFQPWNKEFDELAISLLCNGMPVNSAAAKDVLGGPSLSAELICSEARTRGYDLTPDMILMTGACGQVVPAEEGKYEADFGVLGTVHLDIK
jgi:2-keto-4-pentenoate hydratase